MNCIQEGLKKRAMLEELKANKPKERANIKTGSKRKAYKKRVLKESTLQVIELLKQGKETAEIKAITGLSAENICGMRRRYLKD